MQKSEKRPNRPHYNQEVTVIVKSVTHGRWASYFVDTNGETWEGKADIGMVVTLQWMSQWLYPEWLITHRDRPFSADTIMAQTLIRIEDDVMSKINNRSKYLSAFTFEQRHEMAIKAIEHYRQ